ncbi:MAG TPA: hypothetical protein VE153_38390 [Myxococcus sp.]|nr:hypothetical protein [Myxococcus sp.]
MGVYGVSALLRLTSERMPWAWSAVLTWSGLRGPAPWCSACPRASPPGAAGEHDFGVVVLSIIVQGLTMAPLLARLDITGLKDASREQYGLARGRLGAAHAALEGMRRARASRRRAGAAGEGLPGEGVRRGAGAGRPQAAAAADAAESHIQAPGGQWPPPAPPAPEGVGPAQRWM